VSRANRTPRLPWGELTHAESVLDSTRQFFMTPSSALRRLPRSLGRLAQPLRAEGYANVRALHSASRAAAASDDASLGSRAALVASAFAATTLLSATALAEQAAVAATLPNDPADALKSLKSLADAKEIVLYQYEVCPFCNKARTATVVPCDVCPSSRVKLQLTPQPPAFRCQLRAFLDFHQIPYKVVEVNPLTKKELKWSAYTKVRGRKSIASCQRTTSDGFCSHAICFSGPCPCCRWRAAQRQQFHYQSAGREAA
jgi:hypothetical protein